jgi:signal transduction histidine kinase
VESNINQMSFTSQMMHHLMLDLLNLAQFESGTFRINNGYFNLINLIKHSFKMLEHFSSKKNITFDIQIEGDKLCFQQIHGDEMRYKQILLNFLSNSIKFSPKNAQIIVGLKVT